MRVLTLGPKLLPPRVHQALLGEEPGWELELTSSHPQPQSELLLLFLHIGHLIKTYFHLNKGLYCFREKNGGERDLDDYWSPLVSVVCFCAH